MIILNELVTGGYTKIATIVSTDLPKAGQVKPGDRVRFEPVSVAEGHRLLKEQEERLGRFKESFTRR
jgi:allophanate hydrolase subunit 2